MYDRECPCTVQEELCTMENTAHHLKGYPKSVSSPPLNGMRTSKCKRNVTENMLFMVIPSPHIFIFRFHSAARIPNGIVLMKCDNTLFLFVQYFIVSVNWTYYQIISRLLTKQIDNRTNACKMQNLQGNSHIVKSKHASIHVSWFYIHWVKKLCTKICFRFTSFS